MAVVEHSRSEERCKWEWKLVFKKLSGDLSQAVETTLLDQMQASLGVETQTWEQQHTLRTVAVDVIMQGGKMDYPKVISEVGLLFLSHPFCFLKIHKSLRSHLISHTHIFFMAQVDKQSKSSKKADEKVLDKYYNIKHIYKRSPLTKCEMGKQNK